MMASAAVPPDALAKPDDVIRYRLLYLRLIDIDLIKDPGAIPSHLARRPGVDAQIIAHENEPLTLRGECAAEIGFVRKGLWPWLDGVLYLLRNARKIDVLHLFKAAPSSLVWALTFRLARPRGVVYLKLDAKPEGVRVMAGGRTLRSRLYWSLVRTVLRKAVDIISAETTAAVAELHLVDSRLGQKALYFPNGWSGVPLPADRPKKQQVLYVGKFGDPIKAAHRVIEGFLEAGDSPDWTLHLVGSVDSAEFREWLDEVIRSDPRIVFHDFVADRARLFELMSDSVIFALSSLTESFSISLAEAAASGAYLVTTEVGAAMDIIESSGYGISVPADDEVAYRAALANAIRNWPEIARSTPDVAAVRERFDYAHNVARLEEQFRTKLAERRSRRS
jgi:glycosyltransferase involved in cell wall biosynthesis